ncbi:hypothetical protein CKO28_15860 [Rhodovibrio sodomensis]|uniref:CopG family transcriptional regulator n=1 Tax=Rhodovibrio sodomensis TaxID=1088 RepID=A0ABS1DJF4_9PROT|nr:hypothetical protein [Rhodovibrio sodomensis]MBK1669515.1 hypothetical protein [Rhodovibrio sodomensis]
MAKKPNVQIRAPGQADTPAEKPEAAPTETPERDPRVALTVKVSALDYERLMLLKARKRRPVQALTEAAIKDMLDNEGV